MALAVGVLLATVNLERPRPVVLDQRLTQQARTAAEIGSNVARYLRAHGRKPYVKDATLAWMVTQARSAWRAALQETGAREGPGAHPA